MNYFNFKILAIVIISENRAIISFLREKQAIKVSVRFQSAFMSKNGLVGVTSLGYFELLNPHCQFKTMPTPLICLHPGPSWIKNIVIGASDACLVSSDSTSCIPCGKLSTLPKLRFPYLYIENYNTSSLQVVRDKAFNSKCFTNDSFHNCYPVVCPRQEWRVCPQEFAVS